MSELTNIIISTLGSTALTSLAQGPTDTLSQWWYYHFGYKSEIKYLKRKKEVEDLYKQDIVTEVVQIPEENIQEPKMNILGPALEASKYYIDDKELRVLFAKLVASSMDKSKNDISQPAFVEIVKQMTPLDAQNLISLYKNSTHTSMIVNLNLKNLENGSSEILFENLYINNTNEANSHKISSSLDNLKRLGLVKIDYLKWFSNENLYDVFKENYLYKHFKDKLSHLNSREIELEKGIIYITNFGLDFCKICL